jgi:hypothetical protein
MGTGGSMQHEEGVMADDARGKGKHLGGKVK